MKEFQVAYVPIGVPTFHIESAQQQFEQSIDTIKSLTEDGIYPDELLLSLDALRDYLEQIHPDLIILQNTTFANAAYACEILKRWDCPILLWTLREPVIDGGRLRLNSLTGAYSAANAMHGFGRKNFSYVYGGPMERDVKIKLHAVIDAARVKKALTKLNIAAIGHTPQGFGFGRALDVEMLHTFGANLVSIEVRELIEKAKSYNPEECVNQELASERCSVGMSKIPQVNRINHARLLKAYEEFIRKEHIGALSSRCWPDLFVDYGTPVCAVLSLLNDEGVAASCEADTYGALSMYIGRELSGHSVFFGDPVSLDEKSNTITYWHCGMAPCSLARVDTGATIGVHPNRKIGPVMDFGCKPCEEVTIFRIGKDGDGDFRAFLAGGRAIDAPKQFSGTSVVVETIHSAKAIVEESVKAGFEPHFVVIYADVREAIRSLCEMLCIEVIAY